MEEIIKYFSKDEKILWKNIRRKELSKKQQKKIKRFFPYKDVENYFEINLITNKRIIEKSYPTFEDIIYNWNEFDLSPEFVYYHEDICFGDVKVINEIYVDIDWEILFSFPTKDLEKYFYIIFFELNSFLEYKNIIEIMKNLLSSLVEIKKNDENKQSFAINLSGYNFESHKLRFIFEKKLGLFNLLMDKPNFCPKCGHKLNEKEKENEYCNFCQYEIN